MVLLFSSFWQCLSYCYECLEFSRAVATKLRFADNDRTMANNFNLKMMLLLAENLFFRTQLCCENPHGILKRYCVVVNGDTAQ